MSTAHEHHDQENDHDHSDHDHSVSAPKRDISPSGSASDSAGAPKASAAKASGGHAHHHADARKLSKKRILTVLAMTGSFMIIEAIAGWMTGSLSLVADAGHMFGDVAALALALGAIWLSSKPANASSTYGYHRSEILAALANSVLLVIVSIFVFAEAISRFSHPPEVHGIPMLIVAVAGLVVNLISMRLLTDSADKSLNAKAAYLEVLSDMIASIGVIVAATLMITMGWYLADPILSALLSLFILGRTWGLLKESIDILMENAPNHVDLRELTKSMSAVAGVVAVHDLHVWTITSGMIAMSGHVAIKDGSDGEVILDELKELLEHQYEISHTTIQLENESTSRRCNDICMTI